MSFSYADILSKKKIQVFLRPDELLTAAAEYFDHVHDHPLQEEKLFKHEDSIIRDYVSKVRAFNMAGLAAHLGMSKRRLNLYRKQGPEWEDAFERIEELMYSQKFENAAAGLLNANIVARELGMAEKQEVSNTLDTEGNAVPLTLNLVPVQSGTYLPPEENKE